MNIKFRKPPHAAESKIPAIKAVRRVTGLGLKEAKDVVDNLWYNGEWSAPQKVALFYLGSDNQRVQLDDAEIRAVMLGWGYDLEWEFVPEPDPATTRAAEMLLFLQPFRADATIAELRALLQVVSA